MKTLFSVLRTTDFALQLDESTLPGNEALLLACARFRKDESLVQELLFARLLDIHTKGESLQTVITAVNEIKSKLSMIDFFECSVVRMMNILNVRCFIQKFDGCRKATVLGSVMTSLILLWSFLKEFFAQ
jgi:hypothetical protein